MFTLIDTNKTSTFFIGDIHGEFKAIGNWIKQNNLHDCIIIFCGDFGLGFSSIEYESSELKKSNKICEKNNIDCYIIRGNHDDPSYFNDFSPKLNLSHFKTVSDYTVICTQKHDILCLGGAISIDRAYRKSQYIQNIETLINEKHISRELAVKKVKQYWWEDEPFIYDETILNEINKTGVKIDVVASHSAPDFCQPNTKGNSLYWSRLDKDLENDLYNERLNLTKAYNHIKKLGNDIRYWFYGHYHQHNFEIIEGTRFTGLDMGRLSKDGSGGVGGIFDMIEMKE